MDLVGEIAHHLSGPEENNIHLFLYLISDFSKHFSYKFRKKAPVDSLISLFYRTCFQIISILKSKLVSLFPLAQNCTVAMTMPNDIIGYKFNNNGNNGSDSIIGLFF